MATNQDLVGIFANESYEQLFLNASLMSVSVVNNSKLMTHPLEDGSQVGDHQIFELIRISVPVVLSSADFVTVYRNIEKSFRKNTLYTIQTKVSVYKNMLIESMPHEETVESGIRLVLSFIEFLEQKTAVGIAPKYPKDTPTTKKGVQNGGNGESSKGNDDAPEKKTSFIKGLYK